MRISKRLRVYLFIVADLSAGNGGLEFKGVGEMVEDNQSTHSEGIETHFILLVVGA